jgi:outer membrane receptor protein involved in Fe transport
MTPKTIIKRGLLASTALGMMALTAPQVAAADAQIDEIVVTAQKREQGIQSVPIAISALTGDSLTRKGITDLTAANGLVPGLAVANTGPGETRVSIRGLSASGFNFLTGATIGYYLDEVPTTLSNNAFLAQMDPDFFDVARIEVLRGPQGTLYGAGSMGGTVKFVHNQPNFDGFSGRARVTLSDTRYGGQNYELNGVVNAPVVDDILAIRASAYLKEDSGYIDFVNPDGDLVKDANDVETKGGRLAVLLTPSENVKLTASVFHNETDFDSRPVFDEALGGFQKFGWLPSDGESESTLYNFVAEMDFGYASLTSSTAYLDRSYSRQDDYSNFISGALSGLLGGTLEPSPNLLNLDTEQFSHETRLASNGEEAFNWVFGVFYASTKNVQTQDVLQLGFSDAFGDTFGGFDVSDDVLFSALTRNNTTDFAGFGEVSYDLTDRLEVTVGFRAYKAEQRNRRNGRGLFNGGITIIDRNASQTGINPKFLVSYEADEGKLLYATAAKGFRAGGTNNPIPDACAADIAALGLDEQPNTFDSDGVWNYELGAKTDWMNRRLRFNAAVYQIDWNAVQQNISLGCGFGFIGNAGKAKSQGIEIETTMQVTEGLELSGSFNYNDATISVDAPGIGAEAGDRLLEVPKYTGSFSAQYSHQFDNGLGAYIRGDYSYFGEVQQRYPDTAPNQFRPSYELVNARIGVTGEYWEAALFVRNLFDKRGFLQTSNDTTFILDLNPSVVTRPRTIGLSLTGNF